MTHQVLSVTQLKFPHHSLSAVRREEEARVQPAIWVAGHLTRLHTTVEDLLLQEACPFLAGDRAETSSLAVTSTPT